MIKLIPMAGEGSRFKAEGYTTPKPLLPITNKPMVVQATLALPPAEKNIFILRDFHITEFQIDKTIKKYIPNAELLILDKLTEGQAATCLHAKNLINNSEELIIGASDNGMIYNFEKFEQLKQNSDAIVFTFKNNQTVLAKPEAYGWVIADEQNIISDAKVKYKMPNPMQNHAIVGTFWFREGSYFVQAAEQMIAQNIRINNEFYVDECINNLIGMGKKVVAFEIDHYICWGTPNDYNTFNYWENYFKNLAQHPYGK